MAKTPEKRILIPTDAHRRMELEQVLRADGWLPLSYASHLEAEAALSKAPATAVIFLSPGNDLKPVRFVKRVRNICPNAFLLALGGQRVKEGPDAVLGEHSAPAEVATTVRLGAAMLDARAVERSLREQLGTVGQQSRMLAERVRDLEKTCTSLKDWAHSAQALALRDELTGLYNRRHFLQVADKEIERARRDSAQFSLALIDIDHFKRFNDTYGHVAGDQMLKRFSNSLVRNFRRMDTVARYGGEEFIVLLPETRTSKEAPVEPVRLMERLRLGMDRHVFPDYKGKDPRFHLTISAGLGRYPDDGGAVFDLITKVDQRLYRAKATGRNRLCSSDD